MADSLFTVRKKKWYQNFLFMCCTGAADAVSSNDQEEPKRTPYDIFVENLTVKQLPLRIVTGKNTGEFDLQLQSKSYLNVPTVPVALSASPSVRNVSTAVSNDPSAVQVSKIKDGSFIEEEEEKLVGMQSLTRSLTMGHTLQSEIRPKSPKRPREEENQNLQVLKSSSLSSSTSSLEKENSDQYTDNKQNEKFPKLRSVSFGDKSKSRQKEEIIKRGVLDKRGPRLKAEQKTREEAGKRDSILRSKSSSPIKQAKSKSSSKDFFKRSYNLFRKKKSSIETPSQTNSQDTILGFRSQSPESVRDTCYDGDDRRKKKVSGKSMKKLSSSFSKRRGRRDASDISLPIIPSCDSERFAGESSRKPRRHASSTSLILTHTSSVASSILNKFSRKKGVKREDIADDAKSKIKDKQYAEEKQHKNNTDTRSKEWTDKKDADKQGLREIRECRGLHQVYLPSEVVDVLEVLKTSNLCYKADCKGSRYRPVFVSAEDVLQDRQPFEGSSDIPLQVIIAPALLKDFDGRSTYSAPIQPETQTRPQPIADNNPLILIQSKRGPLTTQKREESKTEPCAHHLAGSKDPPGDQCFPKNDKTCQYSVPSINYLDTIAQQTTPQQLNSVGIAMNQNDTSQTPCKCSCNNKYSLPEQRSAPEITSSSGQTTSTQYTPLIPCSCWGHQCASEMPSAKPQPHRKFNQNTQGFRPYPDTNVVAAYSHYYPDPRLVDKRFYDPALHNDQRCQYRSRYDQYHLRYPVRDVPYNKLDPLYPNMHYRHVNEPVSSRGYYQEPPDILSNRYQSFRHPKHMQTPTKECCRATDKLRKSPLTKADLYHLHPYTFPEKEGHTETELEELMKRPGISKKNTDNQCTVEGTLSGTGVLNGEIKKGNPAQRCYKGSVEEKENSRQLHVTFADDPKTTNNAGRKDNVEQPASLARDNISAPSQENDVDFLAQKKNIRWKLIINKTGTSSRTDPTDQMSSRFNRRNTIPKMRWGVNRFTLGAAKPRKLTGDVRSWKRRPSYMDVSISEESITVPNMPLELNLPRANDYKIKRRPNLKKRPPIKKSGP